MSRINDALKRAKRAQKDTPRPPPTLAAPVQTTQPRQSDFSLSLLLALAGVLVLAGGLTAFVFLRHGSPQTPAGATALSTTQAQTNPIAAPPLAPGPSELPFAVTPPALAPVAAAPPPLPEPDPALPSTLFPPPTQPALPVLQGIFYRHNRPLALIDGKTVRVGADLGDFRVLAITSDTVTVGNASQTNVLRLPEQ